MVVTKQPREAREGEMPDRERIIKADIKYGDGAWVEISGPDTDRYVGALVSGPRRRPPRQRSRFWIDVRDWMVCTHAPWRTP